MRTWQGRLPGAKSAFIANRQFSQNISANISANIPTRISALTRIGTTKPCTNPTYLLNRDTRSPVRD